MAQILTNHIPNIKERRCETTSTPTISENVHTLAPPRAENKPDARINGGPLPQFSFLEKMDTCI